MSEEEMFECEECDKEYKTEKGLKNHIKTKHLPAPTSMDEFTGATETFTIKLNNKLIKNIIETFGKIIDEIIIQVSEIDGLTIEAMDPSKICLLNLNIPKTSFDEFKINQEFIKIGINVDDLNKILNRSNPADNLEISFKEAEQRISIRMTRGDSSRVRSFRLGLLDLDYEAVPMDNLKMIEYTSKWGIEPEFFVEAIKDAEIYSEILHLKTIENGGLEFSSSGQIGDMSYELGEDDLESSNINSGEMGSYSITFLKSILNFRNVTDKLELSLKTDHPFKFEFNLIEDSKLFVFLAPRVDDGEGEEDYDDEMEEF